MKGTVKLINASKGFIAVETSPGEYSVMELSNVEEVEIGDVISGDLEGLGHETVFNETQSEEIDVIIENCHCSLRDVRQMM